MPIVTGCVMLNLNIIQLCGGDRTLGSKDDIIRDVISRLSNYHFVTNSQSKKNLINLGLEQNSIFNVGHIPLQDMGPSKVDLVKLAKQINIVVRKQNILVTLHPDTTKSLIYNESLVDNTFDALFALPHAEHTILVTGSNADEGALHMERRIKERIAERDNCFYIDNLGMEKFRKVLSTFQLFLGNSSSIFYEAPEFPIVSVNIGDRQKGRIMNSSIFLSTNSRQDIYESIEKGLATFPCSAKNLYKNENCISEIIERMKTIGVLNA